MSTVQGKDQCLVKRFLRRRYFEKQLEDTYQWLESQSRLKQTWLNEQEAIFRQALKLCTVTGNTGLVGLKAQLLQFFMSTAACTFLRRGDFLFRSKATRTGRRYLFKHRSGGRWRFLYDTYPHEKVVLVFSPHGRFAAVLSDANGQELYKLEVMKTTTGVRRNTSVFCGDLHIVWLENESGFYYCAPAEYSMVDPTHNQFADRARDRFLDESAKLLYESSRRSAMISPESPQCGTLRFWNVQDRYSTHATSFSRDDVASLGVVNGSIVVLTNKSDFTITDPSNPRRTFKPLVGVSGGLSFLGVRNNNVFVVENSGRENRVLRVYWSNQQYEFEQIYAIDGVVSHMLLHNDFIYLSLSRSGNVTLSEQEKRIVVIDIAGNQIDELASFPEIHELDAFSEIDSLNEHGDSVAIGLSGLCQPGFVREYNVTAGVSLLRERRINFDTDAYVCTKHYVRGESGVQIPVFIASNKERSSTAPVIVSAYGGYGGLSLPVFEAATAAWLEMGGTWVLAQIRGGAELGSHWYAAARRARKQNSINDLICVAKWLVNQGYCTSKQLGAVGVSHGGLLAAAAMVQRPELYGCVVSISSPLDLMNRVYLGGRSKIDYGNPEDPLEYRTAMAISPYHNLRAGVNYPPFMAVVRADDSRVSASHSIKFVAALQTLSRTTDRHLLRYLDHGGHLPFGAAERTAAEAADWLCFAAHHLR